MLSQMHPVSDDPRYLDEAASLAVNDHPEQSVLAAQRHLESQLRASRAHFRRTGLEPAGEADARETQALLQALRAHGTAGTAITALALAEHLERHAAALYGSRRVGRDEALASISLVSDLLDVGEVVSAGVIQGSARR